MTETGQEHWEQTLSIRRKAYYQVKKVKPPKQLDPPEIMLKYICGVDGASYVWFDCESAGDTVSGAAVAVLKHIERQRNLCNEFAETWLNRDPYDDGTLFPPDPPAGG